MFLVAEFVQAYAGPTSTLVGAIITSGTVIWQVRTGNEDIKADIKADISRVEAKVSRVEAEVSRVEKKVDMTNDNILTVTREATAAMETRNYNGMHALAARIKRCQESGGEDC
jgi:septal ring factor EnvC (AmiA/AmiB activator)